MKASLLRQLTLYRFRYVIGYVLYAAFVSILLLVDISSVPRGLSNAEMNSAVASSQVGLSSISDGSIIDWPYHLVQKASIHIFGLTPLSIKLPSIIAAFTMSVVLALMLRQLFRKNVAVITGILATTSIPFLLMGRTGTATIMISFWTTLLLFTAVKLIANTERTFGYKVLALLAGTLLLYTPLGIYGFIALLLAAILHPHVRHEIKRTKWWQMIILFTLGLLTVVPMVLANINHPELITKLFSIPSNLFSIEHLRHAWHSIIDNFFKFGFPTIGTSITPYFDLATAILLLLGLMKVMKDHFSARSYLLAIWIAIVIVVFIINPDNFSLIFVPAMLLLAIGVETLIREWYKLFPRNPYPRMFAIVPIAVLIIGIAATNVYRYYYGYQYAASARVAFHSELQAIRPQLSDKDRSTLLIVDPKYQAFYHLLTKQYPHLTVAGGELGTETRIIVLGDVPQIPSSATLKTIVSSDRSTDSALLRVYTR